MKEHYKEIIEGLLTDKERLGVFIENLENENRKLKQRITHFEQPPAAVKCPKCEALIRR